MKNTKFVKIVFDLVFLDKNETDLQEVADTILDFGKDVLIWTFIGNLGAGKTTLIKTLARKLGVVDNISSPTFSYVNSYDDRIYHFDCYRLKNMEEALDFGFEEYLDSGKNCWIEWPQVIEPLLPIPYLEIRIEHTQNNSRDILLKIVN